MNRLAIVGGGPAGLMAAEVARAHGLNVDVYEGKGSVGRKFLLAGKGGLNLTHAEDFEAFCARYGARQREIRAWLSVVDNRFIRDWARELGVDTMIGTSGRVFPTDLKAAPLLRRWVRRLRDRGVRFHVHHYCVEATADLNLTFRTPAGLQAIAADAVVFALGGGSWPELGSDGAWTQWLTRLTPGIVALEPSNCGLDVGWSEIFAARYAGQPVKSVVVSAREATGERRAVQAEFVITTYGVEGSAIYTHSAALREAIKRDGHADIWLDLAPTRDRARLETELSRSSNRRSLTEHLRRAAGIEGVKTGLLYEFVARADMQDAAKLAAAIKSLPIRLQRCRPIAEAISSAGGIGFDVLDGQLMMRNAPGFFCAGEMVDWEAPTGGYLLTACFASGHIAGEAAAQWLKQRSAISQTQ